MAAFFVCTVIDANGEYGRAIEACLETGLALCFPAFRDQFRSVGADTEIVDCNVVSSSDFRLSRSGGPAEQRFVARAVGDAVADKSDAYLNHGLLFVSVRIIDQRQIRP